MRDVPEAFLPATGGDAAWSDLLQGLDEPAGVMNPRREFVAANDKLLALLGLSASDLAGKRVGQAVQCVNVATGPAGCGSGQKCRYCGANLAILHAQAGEDAREDCRWSLPVGSGECGIDVCIWTFALPARQDRTVFLVPEDSSEEKRQKVAETITEFLSRIVDGGA